MVAMLEVSCSSDPASKAGPVLTEHARLTWYSFLCPWTGNSFRGCRFICAAHRPHSISLSFPPVCLGYDDITIKDAAVVTTGANSTV